MVTGKKRQSLLVLFVTFLVCVFASAFLSLRLVAKADSTDFFMVDGAQVRVDFEDDNYQNAIRFTTKLKKEALPSEGSVKVVTLIVKTERLKDSGLDSNEGFTKENLDDNAISYKTVVFGGDDLTAIESDSYYVYNACVVNLMDTTISADLSARTCIEVNGVIQEYTPFDVEKNSTSIWDESKELVEEYEGNPDYEAEVEKLKDLSATFDVTINGYDKQKTYEFKRGTSFADAFDELYADFTVKNQSYYYGPKNVKVDGVDIATVLADKVADGIFGKDSSGNNRTNIHRTTMFTLDLCKLDNVTCDTETVGLTIENGVVVGVENKGSLKGYTNTVVVPSTYNNVAVTEVGTNAFNQLHGITHVVLADSVNTLGKEAFSQMDSLKTVVMPGVSQVTTKDVDGQFLGTPSLKKIVVGQNFNATRKFLKINTYAYNYDANAQKEYDDQVTVYSTTIGGNIWFTKVYQARNSAWNGEVNYCWEYEEGTYEPVALAEHKYVGEDGVCEHCNHIFEATATPDYTWDEATQSYFITGSSKMTFANNDEGKTPSTNIVIPSWHNDGVHGDARVTRVKTLAFKGNTKITYLQLPYTVTKLGYKCLGAMSNLVTVKMTGKLYLTEGTIDDLRGTYGLGNIFDESYNLKNVIVGPDVYSQDSVQFLRVSTAGDGLSNSKYTISVFCTDDSGELYTIRGGGIRNVYVPGSGNNKTVYYCYRETEPTDSAIKAKAWHYAEDGITPVKW